ncbi:MAG: DUF3987 domain-containing protein [Actinomycetia bacterium]|nr:DUF3987 domain-containing protein [Actinomycetes bacterium]
MAADTWGDYFDNVHKLPTHPVEPRNGSTVTDITHPLVQKVLQARLDELKAMPKDSGRNDALNKAAAYLGRFPIPRPTLRDLLLDACQDNGVLAEDGEVQCNKTISSGFTKADADGPRTIEDRPRQVVDVTPEDLKPKPPLEELEQDFWTARPSHQLIYTAALASMASPWAVFACSVARIMTLVPPSVLLPPIVGAGGGSLNWFGCISAKSGGGKGAAMSVARQLVDTDDILVRGIGSGEGMIEVFNRASKNPEESPPVTSVLFSVDEIDSLGAMGGRSGQTTMSILRQGFSGETLGYSYRGRQSEIVAAHTYRMTLIASVQPERAGILLDDSGGGTPQRFQWFPGRDKRITVDPPQWPRDRAGRLQVIPLLSTYDFTDSAGTLTIPAPAAAEIRATRAASMSGDDGANLDSHRMFCREKLAYALACMDGRTAMNDEDWRLSGIATAVSDWCRAKARDGYRAGKEVASRDRGQQRAIERDEQDLHAQMQLSKHINRIALWARQRLLDKGPATRSELNRELASRDRPRLASALDAAREGGLIHQMDDGRWAAVR